MENIAVTRADYVDGLSLRVFFSDKTSRVIDFGEFIDRSARKKATAKTCYTRASGLFVPEPAEIFPGTLRREYGDKACFALYREGMFCDDAAQRYLAEALRRCR